MPFDNDLVPFEARPQLETLPIGLQRQLRSPWGRAVIRDWAQEHDLQELQRALQPRRFFRHAANVVLTDLWIPHPWTFEVEYGPNESFLTVLLSNEPEPMSREMFETESSSVLSLCHDALWSIGLQPSGLDEIFGGTRTTGWEPRVDFERF